MVNETLMGDHVGLPPNGVGRCPPGSPSMLDMAPSGQPGEIYCIAENAAARSPRALGRLSPKGSTRRSRLFATLMALLLIDRPNARAKPHGLGLELSRDALIEELSRRREMGAHQVMYSLSSDPHARSWPNSQNMSRRSCADGERRGASLINGTRVGLEN